MAHIKIPVQDAFVLGQADESEDKLSFSPAHSLAAHRPLGGINRARLTAYTAMATIRRRENNYPLTEPAGIEPVLA